MEKMKILNRISGKLSFMELVNYLNLIIEQHPLVETVYTNEIPEKDIIYSNVYNQFVGIDIYETVAIARFRFVYNDLLNPEKDNETEIISTGISVIKQIFDKIRDVGFRIFTQNNHINNLTFRKQTNADINVSVSGEISIAFELSNNCPHYNIMIPDYDIDNGSDCNCDDD